MTNEEKLNIAATIEQEGFDYAFQSYGSFKEIGDPEFHRLRRDYVNAAKALEAYIEPESGS